MKQLLNCLLALLCLGGTAIAQDRTGPLTVGDTLPGILVEQVYNYPAASLQLDELNNQYILLDFWSTWCGSCIESFPHLHALQQQYAGRLQVLMVNSYASNTRAAVDKLFRTLEQRTGKAFTLSYVLHDSVLAALFPHQSLPHCVWISPGLKVAAITAPEALTDDHIRNWLKGETLHLPVKNDSLLFDENRDQLDTADTGGMLYRSLLTRYKEGLGSVIGNRTNEAGLMSRYYIINASLLHLYRTAYPEVFNVPFSCILVDTGLTHIAGQLFCYDLVTRPISREQARQALRADLWRSFNIKAVNEKRLLDCYVVSAGKNIQQLYSRGGEPGEDTDTGSIHLYIRNRPVSSLLSFLGSRFPLPWVDETGQRRAIDIRFPADFHRYSLAQVIQFLKSHGLIVRPAKRWLRVAVLKPG